MRTGGRPVVSVGAQRRCDRVVTGTAGYIRPMAQKRTPTTKSGGKASTPGGTARRPRPARAAVPPLLSGGNPQIAKADGDAPVRAYVSAMPGWKKHVGLRIDALIVRAVPSVRKAVRWNSPFYGVEGQGWFLNFHCFTNYVRVAFFRGASLDPVPPGESKDENVRYLDIREADQLDEARLLAWVKQASRLPGWGGG